MNIYYFALVKVMTMSRKIGESIKKILKNVYHHIRLFKSNKNM